MLRAYGRSRAGEGRKRFTRKRFTLDTALLEGVTRGEKGPEQPTKKDWVL